MKEFLERAARGNLSPRDLHIILDALPTPLSWATLPDGRIQFVNRAFTRAFGYEDGRFATVADWISEAYVEAKDQRLSHDRWAELWISKGSGIAEIDLLEVQVRSADRTIRTVQHRGILLYDLGVGIATFEDISDRKLAEEALRRIAFEDPLTGLPNRRMLQERWEAEAAEIAAADAMAAILVIDLDGFKSVNDTLGHDAGDTVLITAAERLRASLRSTDIVCRIGGDEFVAFLPQLRAIDHVEQACWRIGTALARPIALGSRSVTLSASIGAALSPQDGRDLHELMKKADEALYRVKSSRKGEWEWYKVPAAA